MITYILLAVSVVLLGIVALRRVSLSPLLIAAALGAHISSIELARGWPTTFDPPRQGILYGAYLGQYVVISGIEPGSHPRLYQIEYHPSAEEALDKAGGPVMYDMDAKPVEGVEDGSAGEEEFGGLTGEDFTSLEKAITHDKGEAP